MITSTSPGSLKLARGSLGAGFVAAEHRRDLERTPCVNDPVADCEAVGALAGSGSNGHALAAGRRREFPCLRRGTDEPDEFFTSGSVGGVGGNPGSYPEPFGRFAPTAPALPLTSVEELQ